MKIKLKIVSFLKNTTGYLLCNERLISYVSECYLMYTDNVTGGDRIGMC